MVTGPGLSDGISRFSAIFLLLLLLGGCVSDAPDASAELLREGTVELSERQVATFRAVPNPGLLRLREEFSGRSRVGGNFVLTGGGAGEGEEEASYCRLSSLDWQDLVLAEPHPPWESQIPDSRIADIRVSFSFRFNGGQETALTLFARHAHEEDRSVYLSINRNQLVLAERQQGENRILADAEAPEISLNRWHTVEMVLAAVEFGVSLDGEELLTGGDLSWREAGGVILEYRGSIDVDNIRLYSLDQGYQGPRSALAIERLADDFADAALAPWWEVDGNGTASTGANSGVSFGGSDSYQTISGLRSRALLLGEGIVRARFEDPEERAAVSLAIGKPTVMDSVAFSLEDRGFSLARYDHGSGVRLLRAPLPEGAWSDGGAQELKLVVRESVLYGSANGVPLFRQQVGPEETLGTIFAGYLGHFGPQVFYSLKEVEISSRIPDDFRPGSYPDPSDLGNSSHSEPLPGYEKPAPLLEDFDDSDTLPFNVGTNARSSGELAIRRDEDRGGGYLAFSFDMRAGSGLHALTGTGVEADLSGYGGISFKARGTGISRAHISMGEAAVEGAEDRVDAYFPVHGEWQEYRLPFTRDYFAINADSLLNGSDGLFDYEHVNWLMFEVYNYEGEGELHIDDVRFLPPGAKEKLTSRLVFERFETGGQASPFGLQREFHAGGSSSVDFDIASGDGARGSGGYGVISGEKRKWEHLELSYWGGMPLEGHHGFGFSLRGEEAETLGVTLTEIEPRGSVFRPLYEDHRFALPVSKRWVEWRLPFMPLCSRPTPYRPLGNGAMDGWYLEGVSFYLPGDVEARNMQLHLDELFFYESAGETRFDIGLFLPEGGADSDPRLEGVIDSVFRLNLDRVRRYNVTGGMEAVDLEAAFGRAAAGDLDFFLWPIYRRSGENLDLTLKVCNVAAKTVSKTIESSTVVGLDIFHDLDLLSTEVINTLADTNLAFQDRLSRDGAGELITFTDSLRTLSPYWIPFDGGSLRESPSGGVILQATREAEPEGELLLLPMAITEPYFDDIREFSLELGPGRENALFLWNYRGRDGYNALMLRDGAVTVRINGVERQLSLPQRANEEEWITVSASRAESGYIFLLNGTELGRVEGPDVPFGRVGFGVARGETRFRNLMVKYRE